jgi:pyruvate/2-oxoglutarate dehydrogenase complex dihydrolipoamide acyltransferase (E2) component
VRSLIVEEKSVVPVGYVIALMSDQKEEELPEVEAENRDVMKQYREEMLFGSAPASDSDEGEPDGQPAPPPSSGDRVRATPAARQLARTEGVSLAGLPAARQGIVREEDVKRFLQAQNGRETGDE